MTTTAHQPEAPVDAPIRCRPGRHREVWGDRPARRFLLSQAFGQAADAITALVVAKALLQTSGGAVDPRALLQALATATVPYALVGPISGLLADRWDRRRALAIAGLVRATLTLVALAAVASGLRPVGLVAGALLLSAGRTVYLLRAASLPRAMPDGLLVRAESCSLYVGMGALIVGGAIGSAGALFSAPAGLGIAALFQLLCGFGFLAVGRDLGGNSGAHELSLRALADGVHQLVTTRSTRTAMILAASHRALLGALFVTLVMMAADVYGLGESGYVLAAGLTSFGTFLGTLTAPRMAARLRFDGLTIMAFLLPALALPFGVSSGIRPLVVLAISVAFFAFQNLRVAADATVQAGIDDQSRGKVFAAYDAVYNLSYFAGAAVAIGFDANIDPHSAVATAGAIYAACSVALVLCRSAFVSFGVGGRGSQLVPVAEFREAR